MCLCLSNHTVYHVSDTLGWVWCVAHLGVVLVLASVPVLMLMHTRRERQAGSFLPLSCLSWIDWMDLAGWERAYGRTDARMDLDLIAQQQEGLEQIGWLDGSLNV